MKTYLQTPTITPFKSGEIITQNLLFKINQNQLRFFLTCLFTLVFSYTLLASNENKSIKDCTEPEISAVLAIPDTICAGETSKIRIYGSLNDATEWNVYADSCDGPFVGTAVLLGNSRSLVYELEVSPTQTTTYYVQGQGGCTTMGECVPVTINVNTGTPAEILQLSLLQDNICVGNSTTIVITGNLNDASQWNIYTGDCGGTYEGTAVLAGNSLVTGVYAFEVSPLETTTYYISGEGYCVDPSACGAITVNVVDPDPEPATECWETATFNQDTCSWVITGTQPTQPTVSCNEMVAFDDFKCEWVISPAPLNVSITASELPSFCQGALTLTANLDDAVSYLWSTGETTPSIQVSSDGTYSVTVTNSANCSEVASYTVTDLEIDNLISTHTIVATKEIKLYDHNTVINGALGVTGYDGKIEVKKYSNVADLAKADEVNVEDDSSVGQVIEMPSSVTIPDFVYNTVTNDDSQDITVEENQTLTLDGDIYGKIEVKDNATLIFTATNIFAHEIKTKDGATISFSQCANVFLVKGMDLYKNATFNASGYNVSVFADYSVKVGKGSNVIAKIHANDNYIKVEGYENNPTSMKGLFIGKKVEGYKYVTWEQDFSCNPCEIIVPEVPEECECNGGMVEVVIAYSGTNILTTNSGTITNNGDGTFTISDNGEKLSGNLEIYNGSDVADIHTSCSDDIIGMTFNGGIEVIGYTDNEGTIATLDGCTKSPFADCECKGGIVSITVSYPGGAGAILTSNSGTVVDNGNGTYTITNNGEKLVNNFEISDGNNTAEIHTSCSQEVIGVVFAGGIEVVGYVDNEGNTFSQYGCNVPQGGSKVEASKDDLSVSIFPNPTNNAFNITIKSLSNTLDNYTIEVYDIRGQLVLNDTTKSNDYSFGDNLKSGFYFVKIENSNNDSKVIKVIKE